MSAEFLSIMIRKIRIYFLVNFLKIGYDRYIYQTKEPVPMLQFPKNYFQDETVDGFHIEAMMGIAVSVRQNS